jgi:hypothetical protein
LVLAFGQITGGTAWTIECAVSHGRPCYVFSGEVPCPARQIVNIIKSSGIKVLNIAGPRESHRPGVVYEQSLAWFRDFADALKMSGCFAW